MANEPENLILRMLRSLDEKMDTILDRLLDLTARVSSIADQLVGVRTDLVRLEHCMDHFDQRLQRIDRRLNLTEA
jgi:K+/H+ antiporter YhaU regulatory subunit KhtT